MYIKKVISQFDTEWSDFSNFSYSPFIYEGLEYSTVEHAFQAAKVADPIKKEKVRTARTAGEAKILGNLFKDHKNWDKVKVNIMTDLLRCKFSQNQYLSDLLLSTEDAHLEEGNSWGDTYWGTCNGIGLNHLGVALMMVRSELKSQNLKINDINPTKLQLPSEPTDFKLNHPYSIKK